MKKKVLVVDDSSFARRMISDWVSADPAYELVGQATNGEEGLEMAMRLRPDLITLDVEMPKMDGLAALKQIMAKAPCHVIMVSSVTTEGADTTIRALEAGAFDFVTKPGGSNSLRITEKKDELLEKLKAARFAKLGGVARSPVTAVAAPSASNRVVLVASSTGGPRALVSLFSAFPAGFDARILIVQHMPVGFTSSLAKRLDSVGPVRVREAGPSDKVGPGEALLAPGGHHMVVERGGTIALHDGPTRNGCRPAADELFESAVRVYGSNCLGVILTGMGHDGRDGALALKAAGCTVLGESESSCVIYGMPKSAKDAGAVDEEHPVEEMASAICAHLARRTARAS
jgi:two-component system chemotaxis response regulator CheB